MGCPSCCPSPPTRSAGVDPRSSSYASSGSTSSSLTRLPGCGGGQRSGLRRTACWSPSSLAPAHGLTSARHARRKRRLSTWFRRLARPPLVTGWESAGCASGEHALRVRMPPLLPIPLGGDQHVVTHRMQAKSAERTAVSRRLAAAHLPSRPPARLLVATHGRVLAGGRAAGSGREHHRSWCGGVPARAVQLSLAPPARHGSTWS